MLNLQKKENCNPDGSQKIHIIDSNLQKIIQKKNQYSLIEKWIKKWAYPSYSLFFNQAKKKTFSKKEEAERYSVKILEKRGVIQSFFLYKVQKQKYHTPMTRFIHLFWVINPNYTEEHIKEMLLTSNIELFYKILKSLPYQKSLSFIVAEFPKTRNTYSGFKRVKRKIGQVLREYKGTDFPIVDFLKNLDVYYMPKDYKKNKDKLSGSFRIYFNNPYFDSDFIPPSLVKRFKRALKLYQNYQDNLNPYSKSQEKLYSLFQNALDKKNQYLKQYPLIKKELEDYKKDKSKLWNNHEKPKNDYLFNFKEKIVKNISLLRRHNFRIRCFRTSQENFDGILKKNLLPIFMDFIESIPTQGSVFYKFIDIKGNFSDELFCLESIKNFLGDICVFLEKKIKGKWMFVGMAFGNYKRDITYYSKQYYSSLLFLEHFRGYGLAKILTLLAIFYNIDQYDAIIEQSTAFNNVVKNLVQRAGFKDYGLIKNSVYSINPNLNHKNYQKTSECPLVCTGFFRRYIFVENYADIVKQALSKVENDSEVIQRLY